MARINTNVTTIEMELSPLWTGNEDLHTYYFLDVADINNNNRISIYKTPQQNIVFRVTDNSGTEIISHSTSISHWTNHSTEDQVYYGLAICWELSSGGLLDRFACVLDGLVIYLFERETVGDYTFSPEYDSLYIGSSIAGEYICHSVVDSLRTSKVFRTEEELRANHFRSTPMTADDDTLALWRFEGTTKPNNEVTYGLQLSRLFREDSKDFIAIIQVLNPYERVIDQVLLGIAVEAIKPAHTTLVLEYF